MLFLKAGIFWLLYIIACGKMKGEVVKIIAFVSFFILAEHFGKSTY